MQTGYFANEKASTKVHVVDDNKFPICGMKIGDDKSFVWCSAGISINILKCEHCKKIVKKINIKEEKKKIKEENIVLIPIDVFIHYCQNHGINLRKITKLHAHVKMSSDDKIVFNWTDSKGYTLCQAIINKQISKAIQIITMNSLYSKTDAHKIYNMNIDMWIEYGVSYMAQENTEFPKIRSVDV